MPYWLLYPVFKPFKNVSKWGFASANHSPDFILRCFFSAFIILKNMWLWLLTVSVPRRNKEGGEGGGERKKKERKKEKEKRPGGARVVAISRQHVWDRVSRHFDVWCVAGGRGAEGVGQKALLFLPVVSVC